MTDSFQKKKKKSLWSLGISIRGIDPQIGKHPAVDDARNKDMKGEHERRNELLPFPPPPITQRENWTPILCPLFPPPSPRPSPRPIAPYGAGVERCGLNPVDFKILINWETVDRDSFAGGRIATVQLPASVLIVSWGKTREGN